MMANLEVIGILVWKVWKLPKGDLYDDFPHMLVSFVSKQQ